ncbi:MAG: glycerol-3-phosphate 1-O-acyltransferase PlsY [Verrucomicrobiaceae bacterium]|jgi:glycerol-3-phosphate acyltransferase PlsY|nr:glycerol-3-phosphate 1-O-acyltransferase PlsY [Verrucomicrobiaceae bacterium]
MEHSLNYIITALVGYLFGAIPFAVIIAKSCGVDIFKAGSGNPGATNVKRSCGKFAGNLCFLLDALKGFLAASFPYWIKYFGVSLNNPEILIYVGLASAIIGHSFSIFIKFKGGKGVAVTIGGLLFVMIIPILIGLALWVIVFYASRYVSLASIVMAVSLPVSSVFFYGNSIALYVAIAIAVIIVYRHRSNISRLLKGTENRF